MFKSATYNVTGAVPFNANKFPILISVNGKSVLCTTPDEVPRGVDFTIDGTCIATIGQRETDDETT